MGSKIKDVRNRDSEDLERQIEENTRELFNLKFQKATEKSENPVRIRVLRKEVARMRTVIRERQLGIGAASEKED